MDEDKKDDFDNELKLYQVNKIVDEGYNVPAFKKLLISHKSNLSEK